LVIISVGASWSPTDFATVSADFEMVDFSNIEFDGSNELDALTLSKFNSDIRRTFRNTNNFRVGAEFNIPETGLFLRGGFGYRYSPYDADDGKSEYDIKTISAGIGYKFHQNIAIQAAYVMSNYETFSINYDEPDRDIPESAFTSTQEISVTQLMFGLAYYF
jgi:long-subunit fatty acid transport protein